MHTKTLAPFMGGVNRQALAYRPAPGVYDAENVDFSPLRGATKRAPLRHISSLPDLSGFDPDLPMSCYLWEHRSGTRYGLVYQGTGAGLKAFNADTGQALTVSLKSGTANYNYLPTAGNESDLRFTAAGDRLFLLNRAKVPALKTGAEAAKATTGECLVHVRRSNYERLYSLVMGTSAGNVSAIYTTPAAGAAAVAAAGVSSSLIASQLAGAFNASSAVVTGGAVVASAKGSTIRLTGNFSTVQNVYVSDGDGGTSLTSLWKSVEGVDQLPKLAYHGYRVKIAGATNADDDDFYVKFVADDPVNAPFGEGKWEESPPYGIDNALDEKTLPHALELTSGGHFEFAKQPWVNRIVGDNDTNPFPSFISGIAGGPATVAAHVGTPISTLLFFAGRLWLFAGPSIVASEVGDPFNLMRTTVRSVPASERLDLQETEAKEFYGAVADNESLVLFARSGIYSLTLGATGSVQGADLRRFVALDADQSGQQPHAVMGTGVFSASRNGEFGAIVGLSRSADAIRYSASEVSAAVPDWFGPIAQIHPSPHVGALFILCTDAADRLIRVRLFPNSDGVLRAAWSSYRFSVDIKSFGAFGSTIYAVVAGPNGLSLAHLDITDAPPSSSEGFRCAIDRRLSLDDAALTKSYDATTGVTTFTLPYEIETGDVLAVVSDDGAEFTVTSQSSGPGANAFAKVRGDKTAQTGHIGVVYEAYLTIARPVLREQEGYAAMDAPALVQEGVVQYDKSGPFEIVVSSLDGRSFESQFAAPVGQYGSTVGETTPLSGGFRFPVRLLETEATVRFQSSSAVPFSLQGVSWTHREFSRGRGRR